MARAELGLSDDDFWDMSPRTFSSLHREWRNIQIGKNRLQAYIAQGGEIEIDDGQPAEQVGDARFL